MNAALVLSIFVKGFGAVLEFANQIIITRFGGVALFGTYNLYVSIAEVVCWVFFSGIVKTNAFYVANGKDISWFHRRFFLLFALPLILLAAVGGAFYSLVLSLAFVAAFLYAYQLNLSSIFLACRQYRVSILGEYVISRVVQLAGFGLLAVTGNMSAGPLVCVYALGFFVSVLYFTALRSKRVLGSQEMTGGERRRLVRKQLTFQLNDVANGLINQAPVIIQYTLSGAFQAGVLSVVLVARKAISFIAGPTAKIYLPEFAQRYVAGDMAGLARVYRNIVLLQMCFVLPICLLIVGAPGPILSIYNSELVGYEGYLRLAAAIFMLTALFGPQGNLLAMVGQERVEAITRWLSLLAMVLVMAVTYGSDLFVLYGIGAQVVVDAGVKLSFVTRLFGGFPLRVSDWLKLGVPFAALVCLSAALSCTGLAKLAVVCLFAVLLMVIELFMFFREEIKRKLVRR